MLTFEIEIIYDEKEMMKWIQINNKVKTNK